MEAIPASSRIKKATAVRRVPLLSGLILLAALFCACGLFPKPEVHTDVSEYGLCRSRGKLMYETIWPEAVTDEMNVLDYKMVYYNPWDAQYLGYLVVEYEGEAYERELSRLAKIGVEDYVGFYSVTGFTKYELVAMDADSYAGFVYALTDGRGKIIYAEEMFCNYFMDLDYKKYIPAEYLPDGFDAAEGNPYAEKHR